MDPFDGIAGRRLEDLLGGSRTLARSDARTILLGVCDRLDAAHRAGVLHRDLEPQNILVVEEGAVKIIDFGLALAVGSAGLTAMGLIVGTPEYMAPEQVRGGPQDERTDVYALGVVLYRALCGVFPFSGPNPIAAGFAHFTEEPRPPRAIRAELPADVEEAIRRALAREPPRSLPLGARPPGRAGEGPVSPTRHGIPLIFRARTDMEARP
jgi:serine/threonine-protein kinase